MGACGDSTGPAGTAPVELRFATVATTSAVTADGASPALAAFEPAALTIPANGGVFEIADVQFIVSEMALDPALEIPANDVLTINVDPSVWFAGFDLLAADGQLVEFEMEMEDGFVEVEIDDED